MTTKNIASLRARVQYLEDSKTPRQQIINNMEQHLPRLAELKNQRIQVIAQARISGVPAPDTGKLDKEITDTEKALLHDREESEIATAEIAMIEAQKQEIESAIYEEEQSILQAVLDDLNGEFAKAIQQYEKILRPELHAALSTIPLRLKPEGFSVAMNVPLESIPVSVGQGKLYDFEEIFLKMETVLRPALHIAYVQDVFLDDNKNKRRFLDAMKLLGSDLLLEVRTKNIRVPEWAFCFGGHWEKWNSSELLEPIVQGLRTAGAIQ